MKSLRLSGMRAFIVLAVGQSISLTGSVMTQFALGIWVWEQTGEATPFAWIALANALPVLLSPVTGVLVDRINRKLAMMLSDIGSGIVTLIYLLLFATGQLQIWHLYVGAFISSLFGMFQWPAYSAAISVMVPKAQYTRANALQGLAESASGILAPALAATLIVVVGIQGVMVLDLLSLAAAIGTLLLIRIPKIERSEEAKAAQANPYAEMSFGFRYIFSRPSLLGLQLLFLSGNFLATMAFTLSVPMLLARTGNNEQVLGVTQSAIAIGLLLGGLLLSAWGGPARRVYGVIGGWFFSSLFGFVLFSLSRTPVAWVVTAFFGALPSPTINGSNQAIWQAKVPPDVQGKVFSIRRMIAWGGNWLAALIVGPLADRLAEPAMQDGGPLASMFGGLFGVGPGAGMALIIFLSGIGAMTIVTIASMIPTIRDAEDLLPDHTAVLAAAD